MGDIAAIALVAWAREHGVGDDLEEIGRFQTVALGQSRSFAHRLDGEGNQQIASDLRYVGVFGIVAQVPRLLPHSIKEGLNSRNRLSIPRYQDSQLSLCGHIRGTENRGCHVSDPLAMVQFL